MTGTVLNVAAVLLGGALGLLAGRRMSEQLRQHILVGIGLFTIVLGIRMSLSSNSPIIVLGSLIIGGFVGHVLNIDGQLIKVSDWFVGKKTEDESSRNFSHAFVTSSLIFCAGPLTIVGSILDGISGDFHPLALKSVLDGFTAIALSASLGAGVLCSAATVATFQGGISIVAMLLSGYLGGVTSTSTPIVELGSVGGVLIVAIGLTILDLKAIRVANFIPAVLIAPVLCAAL